jgi:hypothetical protein
MPSIMKLLLLVAIIWIVWRGFNRISAVGQASRNRQQGNAPNRPGDQPGRPQQNAAQRPVEDMVKCPKCGAYVSAAANHRCE